MSHSFVYTVDHLDDSLRSVIDGKDFLPASDDVIRLELDITAEGYHQPARRTGPPENCYPAEGDFEIRHLAVTFVCEGGAFELDEDDEVDVDEDEPGEISAARQTLIELDEDVPKQAGPSEPKRTLYDLIHQIGRDIIAESWFEDLEGQR